MAEAQLAETLVKVLIERLWLDLLHALWALSVIATDCQLAVLFNAILAKYHFAMTALAGIDRYAATDYAF